MKVALLVTAILTVALSSGCSDGNNAKAEAEQAKVEAEKAKAEAEKAKAEAEKAKAELELAKLKTAGGQVALEGEVTIDVNEFNNLVNQEKLIYYKRPFVSPPFLTITAGRENAGIEDQKADSFRLIIYPRGRDGRLTVTWKAEGLPRKE